MTPDNLWLIVLGCGAATFIWRLLGVLVVKRIDAQGRLFQWVTCVSDAMVAGLIFQRIVTPESELANVSLPIRLTALALAFSAYYVFGRRLVAGVVTGGVSLSALVLLLG